MPGTRTMAVAVAAALAALAAGCSKSEPEQTPVACLDGPGAYLEALGGAPADVRLEGETPISDCLTPGQEGGDLADAGSAMIAAATSLNAEARRDPAGRATIELGYLVGAAERGAEDTSGIHSDLILRLTAAARFSPSGEPSAEFERGYQRGLAAGKADG